MVKLYRANQQNLIEVGGGLVNSAFLFQTEGATAIGSEVVLGDQGGQTLEQLHDTTGATLKFISSSANDKTGSTGLLTTRLWGVDTDDVIMYEDITCNGDTAVTLDNTDWKTIFFLEPLTYGSAKKAVGNCHITNSAGDAYYLAIAANGFQSNYLNLYVPANAIAYFEFKLWFTKATTDTDGVVINQYQADGATNEVTQQVMTFGFGTAKALTTFGKILPGLMKGGYHHLFKGVDVGTTAQTLNYSLTWGIRYT
jgi:hypothetical protein